MSFKIAAQSLWAIMRFNRPIGFLLIGWPTLAALWLAQGSMPSMRLIVLFVAGIIITRSAGCVINDICDRKFDGHVARTQQRPLASGQLSVKAAFLLLFVLAVSALFIVMQLNWLCFYLALGAIALSVLYPLCKRFLPIPQTVLALTFNWGILIAFAAVDHCVPLEAFIWMAANAFWTLAYDTQYALMDVEDDLKIGLHSSAVYFGQASATFICFCQWMMLVLLVATGLFFYLSAPYYIAIVIVCALFVYQYGYTKTRTRPMLLIAFKNNHWVGFALFVGIILSSVGNIT